MLGMTNNKCGFVSLLIHFTSKQEKKNPDLFHVIHYDCLTTQTILQTEVCVCVGECVNQRGLKRKAKKIKKKEKNFNDLKTSMLQNSCNHLTQKSNKYTCLYYFTFLNVEQIHRIVFL